MTREIWDDADALVLTLHQGIQGRWTQDLLDAWVKAATDEETGGLLHWGWEVPQDKVERALAWVDDLVLEVQQEACARAMEEFDRVLAHLEAQGDIADSA